MPILPSGFEFLCMLFDKVTTGEEIYVKEVRHMAEALQLVDELHQWDNFLRFADMRGIFLRKGSHILIAYKNPRDWFKNHSYHSEQ
jgi:hypothetical protein